MKTYRILKFGGKKFRKDEGMEKEKGAEAFSNSERLSFSHALWVEEEFLHGQSRKLVGSLKFVMPREFYTSLSIGTYL
ncbi:hypothetical protein ACSQ67_025581 [Phaseolus vulgaris]